MFGGPKLKLNKDIIEGAGSSDADITESLRGLGYIS